MKSGSRELRNVVAGGGEEKAALTMPLLRSLGGGSAAAIEPHNPRNALQLAQATQTQAWEIIARLVAGVPLNTDPMVTFDIQGHALLVVNDVYCSIDLLPLDRFTKLGTLLGTVTAATEEKASADAASVLPTMPCDLDKLKDNIRAYIERSVKGHYSSIDFLEPYLNSTSRHSIINIQQEVDMHIRLQLRAVMSCMFGEDLDDRTLSPYAQECMELLTPLVNTYIASALSAGVAPGSAKLDVARVNMTLDQIRPKLFDRAEEVVFQRLRRRYPSRAFPDKDDLKSALKRVPAFYGEYLYTDNENGTAVLIGGTRHTAHDKRSGASHQALRMIERFSMAAPFVLPASTLKSGEARSAFNVFELELARKVGVREARVPSLAVVDGGLTVEQAIHDVKNKIAYAHDRMGGVAADPLIYNLLTSNVMSAYKALSLVGLYKKVSQLDQHQTQSTDIIVQAIHCYNREQKATATTKRCLLQNIPVNQHGTSLDLNSRHTLVREISLMASIALIDTLYKNRTRLPGVEREFIETLFEYSNKAYDDFLDESRASRVAYFCQSTAGKNFKKRLVTMQKYLPKHDRDSSESGDVSVRALYGLFTSGLYLEPQFGALVQTLSIMGQKKTLYGCKSANERWQMIAGRLNTLMGLSAKRREMMLAVKESGGGWSAPELILEALRVLCKRNGVLYTFPAGDRAHASTMLMDVIKQLIPRDETDPARQLFLQLMHQSPETFASYASINFSIQGAYCYDPDVLRKHAEFMQLGLCCAYDNLALYASSSAVSHLDQGAASKVQIVPSDRDSGHVSSYNTNYSERGLYNLRQSNAGNYQAHKSAKRMAEVAKALPPVPKSPLVSRAALLRGPVDSVVVSGRGVAMRVPGKGSINASLPASPV